VWRKKRRHNTRVILGVTCVEVHDSVFTDGALTEDTLDWFAQDMEGDVWYFGEITRELEKGLITTIDGTFMACVNGNKPGMIMKAHPAVGDCAMTCDQLAASNFCRQFFCSFQVFFEASLRKRRVSLIEIEI